MLEARENASEKVAIGFSFDSDWFRKWPEFSTLITQPSKAKPENSQITRNILKNCLGKQNFLRQFSAI